MSLRLSRKRISRTTQANVVEYLRRVILSGELQPGTRLVQSELAGLLQVSVTPIREALWELNSQGLIDLDAFRGAVVHTPTLKELEDIFEVRMALLPISIQRGVNHITPKQLTTAAHILEQMESESDQTRWLEYNRDFHRQLYGNQPNQHLQATLERMADIATVYINLSFTKDDVPDDAQNSPHPLPQRWRSEQDHRAILEAYRQQDQALVTKLSLAHINSTLDAARNILKAQ
ncbi:MAG: GntR family transcriptional regulator [Leptolyngbya sp. SIO3F4]|nr:GntR family transcriptional regulator [Leptolyngbya sp. SIO3F4]